MKKLLTLFITVSLIACNSSKKATPQENPNVKVLKTVPANLNGKAEIKGTCLAINQSTQYRKGLAGLDVKIIGADTSFKTNVYGEFAGQLKPGKYKLETTYEKKTQTSSIFELKENTSKEFVIMFDLVFTP